MTRKEFKILTGEDPVDMFGNDWENEVAELQLTSEDIRIKDGYIADHDCHLSPNDGCDCQKVLAL